MLAVFQRSDSAVSTTSSPKVGDHWTPLAASRGASDDTSPGSRTDTFTGKMRESCRPSRPSSAAGSKPRSLPSRSRSPESENEARPRAKSTRPSNRVRVLKNERDRVTRND